MLQQKQLLDWFEDSIQLLELSILIIQFELKFFSFLQFEPMQNMKKKETNQRDRWNTTLARWDRRIQSGSVRLYYRRCPEVPAPPSALAMAIGDGVFVTSGGTVGLLSLPSPVEVWLVRPALESGVTAKPRAPELLLLILWDCCEERSGKGMWLSTEIA